MGYPKRVPRLVGTSVGTFREAVRSEHTWEQYERRLVHFLSWLGFKNDADAFLKKAKSDPRWVEEKIIEYLKLQKGRAAKREISLSTVVNFKKPLKLFLDMNLESTDIKPNWTKIGKMLPPKGRYAKDRAPTIEEIRRINACDDMRVKVIVSTMVSSGIRIGAWNYLNRGHLKPIQKNGKMVACRLTAYAGTPDEYVTFITPEAYETIEKYFRHREYHGEQLTASSPVLRNVFNTSKPIERWQAEARNPKRLKHSAVKRLIERVLWQYAIRVRKERRHEFMVTHGFRKFFKTQAEQLMRPINVETLMGHSTGISDSYYRPTENQLLEDYLKAVPLLTISEVEEIRQRSGEEKKQLEERLNRIEASVGLLISEKGEQLLSLAESHRADTSR